MTTPTIAKSFETIYDSQGNVADYLLVLEDTAVSTAETWDQNGNIAYEYTFSDDSVLVKSYGDNGLTFLEKTV